MRAVFALSYFAQSVTFLLNPVICLQQAKNVQPLVFFHLLSHLPDTDNSVGDQDEQDDKGLDEGGDRVVILEEGEDEGDDGGEEQDLDKQVIELFQDQLKDGLSLLDGQLCTVQNRKSDQLSII